jgi:molybdopterin-guanine dinucleotide biosynthesis protein A
MSAVLLCGGTSRRMGTDKALVRLDGEPLVLRAAGMLGSFAAQVIVAAGPAGRLGSLLERTPCETVEDVTAGAGDDAADVGPLGGIVAGLEAARHELVAVLAVDMPFASAAVFDLLARRIGDDGAAVPVTSEGSQPLHAVYARRSAPLLRAALEGAQRSVRSALGRIDVRWVHREEWQSADPSGRFAWNLNEPGDLIGLDGRLSVG